MKLPKRHQLDGTPLPKYEPVRKPKGDKPPAKPKARGAHLP